MPIRYAGLGRARRLIAGAAAICAALGPALGQQPVSPQPVQQAGIAMLEPVRRALERIEIEAAMAPDRRSAAVLAELRRAAGAMREQLRERLADLEPRLAEADARLKQLGPPPLRDAPPESASIASERERLSQAFAELDEAVKQTRLLGVRVTQLGDRLAERQHGLYTRELFERSASVLNPAFWIEAVAALPGEARSIAGLTATWVEVVAKRNPLRVAGALSILFAIIFAAFAITRWWLPRFDIRSPAETRLRKAQTGLVVFVWLALRTPLALLAGLFVLQDLGLASPQFEDLRASVVAAIFAAAFGRGVARGLLAPDRPQRRLIALPDAAVPCFHDHLVWSTRIFGFVIWLQALHNTLQTPAALAVATHALFALATAALLVHFVRCVRRVEAAGAAGSVAVVPGGRLLTWLLVTLILAALAAGYVALAAFIAIRLIVAAVVLGLLYLLLAAVDAVFTEALNEDAARGRALAANLGLTPRSLGLVGTLVSAGIRVLLIVAAALLIVGPWEVSTVDLVDSFQRVPLAFRLGEITISLWAVLSAAAILVVALAITRVVQRWLETQLLPRTALAPSLQLSVATIFGYVGAITAVALALGGLGIDLQKIAFIAGALSVGIGFGLQAVVSNFVSGLILLAERPIRVGDAIVVKGEEGWVRRIRVRATEIETYDRASVIIPNSELITGLVKNWTHANTMGRIVIKVGVGYASDPEAVRDILLTAANEHPQVLPSPPPRAFLLGFGESALEFELRCVVAHVEDGLAVKSDLHFAMLRRFRAAGIEIPYPQREVRLRRTEEGESMPMAGAAPAQ
jgi:small-conductance mechanosensitive channel